jgi:hypothetical protein
MFSGMKKILSVFVLTLLFAPLSCSRKKLVFSPNFMSDAMLIRLDAAGYNESKYIFVSEYEKLAKLLNKRMKGKSSERTQAASAFEETYILRFKHLGINYIVKLKDKNNFILNIAGRVRHFFINNMRSSILALDTRYPFDTSDVFSVRLFTKKHNRDSTIKLSAMEKLFDALSKTNDEKRIKTVFSMIPDYIFRIQLTNGGYQLFASSDAVWMSAEDGFYIYSSPEIKDALKAFANL